MKKLLLIGASGSIGTQTVDIILQHPDEFELVSFAVGKNITKAEEYLKLFPDVHTICTYKQDDAELLQERYPDKKILYGEDGLIALIETASYDILVNALVGFAGFMPTLAAIRKGHNVALANKETLVCGGALIREALIENQCELYPIDSEHSAIWQCMQGNRKSQIERLLITCSGGAFRNKSREELETATVEEALAHPNWNMGDKITIDCADLMNKGFEVIEAHWLFDLPYEKIDVVMHPESIVHSAVEYKDHSIIAQMGAPDMRLPIQYALTYPERLYFEQDKPLDLRTISELHFGAPDTDRFPLLALAYETGKKGGNLCAVMNAANEAANLAFREKKIAFTKIEEIVSSAVHHAEFKELKRPEDVIEADKWGREYAIKMIGIDRC